MYVCRVYQQKRSVLKHYLKSPWDSIRSIRLLKSAINAFSSLAACFLHTVSCSSIENDGFACLCHTPCLCTLLDCSSCVSVQQVRFLKLPWTSVCTMQTYITVRIKSELLYFHVLWVCFVFILFCLVGFFESQCLVFGS